MSNKKLLCEMTNEITNSFREKALYNPNYLYLINKV